MQTQRMLGGLPDAKDLSLEGWGSADRPDSLNTNDQYVEKNFSVNHLEDTDFGILE